MIISHSKQVCFWKISRTGSTTIEMLIRLMGGLDITQDVIAETHFFPASHNFPMPDGVDGTRGARRAHITPQTAIDNGFITQVQYDAYENYCMVRDPVDRFISTHALAFPKVRFTPTDIWADIQGKDPTAAIFRTQSEYLARGNITGLPFSDYENSVRTILTAFGAPQPDTLPWITRQNPSLENFNKALATVQDRSDIESFYPDDKLLSF